jgi:hypothetical protein
MPAKSTTKNEYGLFAPQFYDAPLRKELPTGGTNDAFLRSECRDCNSSESSSLNHGFIASARLSQRGDR